MLPRPVPPLATDKALVKVKPVKVGLAVVLIPCIVSTLPLVTDKLFELNEAKPLTVSVASWMVIVPPAVTMLVPVIAVIVMAPV